MREKRYSEPGLSGRDHLTLLIDSAPFFMHVYTDKFIYKCVAHRYILKGLPLSMKKGNLFKCVSTDDIKDKTVT